MYVSLIVPRFLLTVLAYDEKKPVEETRRVLRLAYYFLSTLAHQHNTSNRYFDPVQARLKTDSTSPLRLMLAVRALSGYIHASANRGRLNNDNVLFRLISSHYGGYGTKDCER